MHVSLDTLPGVPVEPFRSTVCIVGAGIAGIVLAHRLSAAGLSVHLLEAGGLDLEDRSQSLYDPEFPLQPHTGSTLGRFRTFGGSSTRWGGQLLPFTPDVFAPPRNTASLPWPIAPADLEPFYPEVQSIMGVDDLPFTADLLPRIGRSSADLPAGLRLRFSKWAPFARRNLAGTLGPALLTHPRVTVYTHANAAALLRGPSGTVRGVCALDYRGRSFEFHARTVVVSTGTVESSRLLLLSNTAVPDPHHHTGRGFHDHVSLRAALLTGPARTLLLDRLGPAFLHGTLHTAKIEASPALREEHSLLSCMAHLVIEEPEDSGTAAVRNLLRSVQQRRLREALLHNLLPMLRGSADVARLLYASRIQRRRAVSPRAQVFLHLDLEQPADPTNRIHLSAHRDALNLPRAAVSWQTGHPEAASARRFAPLLANLLQTAGLPAPTWSPALLNPAETLPFSDTYHPMGGLPMGTNPAQSVVNPHLQHHHVPNLYISSCATFPSGGSSNPTFTLMALTLRLADHLTNQLRP